MIIIMKDYILLSLPKKEIFFQYSGIVSWKFLSNKNNHIHFNLPILPHQSLTKAPKVLWNSNFLRHQMHSLHLRIEKAKEYFVFVWMWHFLLLFDHIWWKKVVLGQCCVPRMKQKARAGNKNTRERKSHIEKR